MHIKKDKKFLFWAFLIVLFGYIVLAVVQLLKKIIRVYNIYLVMFQDCELLNCGII